MTAFNRLLLLLGHVYDSVRPQSWQPTRLPCPWDSPGKNTGVGCHFLLHCVKLKSESEVAQSRLTRSDPWTAAYQVPPSMEFSRQESWSGLPLPSPFNRLHPPLECSCCSVTLLCPTLCDPMDCSTPGFPILHYLLEFAENRGH